MTTWKHRYAASYSAWQLKTYPAGTKDHGTLSPNYPDVTKHNGLRRMVALFLKYEGHHAEMVSNIGRPVQKFIPRMNILSGEVELLKGGIEWQKGSGKNGTSDIHSLIVVVWNKFPIPWYIEIKVGKDFQKEDQIEFEQLVTSKGAIYSIIRTPNQFYELYDRIINNQL